jgi:NAD(P)-dependent dehydrogenase (short-subunit alcohol dehydrogenase family)
MDEYRYDGRVAVITGGGRGLGRCYAELLASRGCKIVVNDNGSTIIGDDTAESPADEVVNAIKAAGGEAIACTESVATETGGQAIIQAALDTWGRIDILIHNAGNVRRGSMSNMLYEDFCSVIDVHLMGAYHVTRAAFPHMQSNNYGRVVLTSSIGGIYGNYDVVNYSMAKAAMIGLSNVITLEGKEHNIKSNIILPGAVTRMAEGLDISQYPPMEPDKVAPVVAWLCHENCPVSGEMYFSVAGRVARALIAETPGVYKPDWSIEDVANNADAIRATEDLWMLAPEDFAFGQHLGKSFAIAKGQG